MSAIVWDRLDESTFNKLVEALLVAEYTREGLRAQAIDGRGGDGGIDIDVRVEKTGQLTQIFQLKHFPEGFSGGFKQRRSQIKESFARAMREKPPVWTLVVPKNPTVNERKVVSAMRGAQKVTIRIIGAAQLDVLLSSQPKIASHFGRNDAIEALREVSRAEAVLAKPDDLRKEVQRLQDRLDGRSAYWGTAFMTEPDGTYVETWYAKRPDAAEREPLSITLKAEFTPADEKLRQRFADKMKYGGSGTLVLPEWVIKELRRDGPEWFQQVSEGGEIHISNIGEHEAQPVKVELFSKQDERVANLGGVTMMIDRGYGGASVETSLGGGLDMRWQFSDDRDEGGNVALNFDPTGATPREVRQTLRFLGGLAPDTQLRLTVAERPTLQVDLADEPDFVPDAELTEFVDDLCIIEEHFDVSFRFPPDGVDASDRIWARVIVRMLEGKPVAMPFTNSFTGTLSGTKDDGLEAILAQGMAVCITNPDWAVEMFGETVSLGEVWIYSHHVQMGDAKEIAAAFEAGTAAGMKVALRPINDEPFLIYAPEFLSKDPNAVVLAYDWGLKGVKEHPKLDSLPNRVHSGATELQSAPSIAQRPLLRTPLN